VFRILTFRARRETYAEFDRRHLVFGLVATWIVGMGRWWDDPGAHLVQKLGLGSVVYVFALATVLWLFLLPLRTGPLPWRHVLTLVTLTAPPAAIYAIPVERWMSVEDAIGVNMGFLAVVASWRVAIVVVWMRRALGFLWRDIAAGLFVPLAGVAWTIAAVNPERANVIEIMGGVRPPTPGDGAMEILQGFGCISILLALPMLFVYSMGVQSAIERRRRKAERAARAAAPPADAS
jgi:hypothetical protein